MFRKNKNNHAASHAAPKKDSAPSLIGSGTSMIGNIVSESTIDFDGTLDGNIRAASITIRHNASVKGEVVADNVAVYGTIKGLIRAQSVHLYASCNVEGIIMHESITIEDGANVDGKFKRTNKAQATEEEDNNNFTDDSSSSSATSSGASSGGGMKMLENIRLIR